jgi:hypothetical protein
VIQVLLVQLPVPQLNFGHKTGNIPFASACLHQAASHTPDTRIDIFPQISASYMGDAALLETILTRRPDIVGFTTYVWNVTRVLYLIQELKTHYSPRIVLGGPEVTDDNPLLADNPLIDFRIQGEGERLFARLLQEPELRPLKSGYVDTGDWFSTSPSPYLSTQLMPEIENSMLLETMRGCPYACAYCYYGKSRKQILFKADCRVIEGLEWALSRDVKEVNFLDPSLNSRPGLIPLLKQVASLNKDHRLSLISEIRADAVDDDLADLLASAGFTWFEIGLQSTNPRALARMHRKADLDRFINGVHALKQRGITTEIDLIVGLPEDDWARFDKTLKFLLDHNLHDDVQVFPLLILPGTEFRRNAKQLGLSYDEHPPYIVRQTPTFSEAEMLDAFIHAGKRLDVSFYPMPDLDLAWQVAENCRMETMTDIRVLLDEQFLHYKVWLNWNRTLDDLADLARRVTHPYQLLIPPTFNDPEFIARALSIFTTANPHTPLELVFFDPPRMPEVGRLLEASRIARPHYLDGDLRPLFDQAGNRAILFTVITTEMKDRFYGPMQRHVHWWRYPYLPEEHIIHDLEGQGFDGMLIDTPLPIHHLHGWQDQMAERAGDFIHITFSRLDLNKRWLQKTMANDYCFPLLP